MSTLFVLKYKEFFTEDKVQMLSRLGKVAERAENDPKSVLKIYSKLFLNLSSECPRNCSQNCFKVVRDHSSITSSKRWVGGVRKWQFLMIYSTVNHQRLGWVGLKKSKT